MAGDSESGEGESGEEEDVGVDVFAGRGGERVTREMIQCWVESAAGEVSHIDKEGRQTSAH